MMIACHLCNILNNAMIDLVINNYYMPVFSIKASYFHQNLFVIIIINYTTKSCERYYREYT